MARLSPSAGMMAAVALVAAAALSLALIAEYGYSLQPCHLCMLQRLPYGAVLFMGAMGTLPAVPPEARRQIVYWCAALFAANAALAAYHAGVEYKWWPGPTTCTGRQTFTLESLAAALTHPGIISCEDAAFRVFGISMAGGNVIACTVLAIASVGMGSRKRIWSAP